MTQSIDPIPHGPMSQLTKYRAFFKLFQVQPWIEKREERFYEFAESCESPEDLILLVDLLQRFTNITSQKESEALTDICQQITARWGLMPETTIVAATAADRHPDSSQQVLQALKPRFGPAGWESVVCLNRYDQVQRHVPNRPNIVLVDEFIGTGRSMTGRINALRNNCTRVCDTLGIRINIFVCAFAAMADSLPVVRNAGATVPVVHVLKRGISAHFVEPELSLASNRMLRWESSLAPTFNGKPLPSFGEGRAEALYCMDNGNTPNSVFPFFWWAADSNGKKRRALLDRFEDLLNED